MVIIAEKSGLVEEMVMQTNELQGGGREMFNN